MSDKYGKSTDIAGQIFAQQPSGIGSAGTPLDLNTIQQSYASTFPMDLDFMDMLEKAADEEEFRMLGVTDAPPLEQRQLDAAQDYIDALSSYISSANSQNKQALDDAKQKLAELKVSRNQVESVTNFRFPEGIDASQGIEGVFGPSIGGAVKQGYENLVDLYGTGALQALGAVIELAGGDKDLALGDTKVGVNPIGPGVNYIFGDDGKARTTPLGQTKTGTPVVLTGPIGAAGAIGGDILRGDIGIFDIPGAVVGAVGGPAGVVQTAAQTGVLGYRGKEGEDTEDIFLDEQAILASILNGDGSDKKSKTTDQVTVDDVDADVDANIQVAGLESKDRADVDVRTAGLGSLDSAGEPTIRTAGLDSAGEPTIRTGGLGGLGSDGKPSIKVGAEDPSPIRTSTVATADTTSTAGGGGGGGAGGFDTPTNGVQTVSVEPGPLVDIPGFYDISSMSIIPDYIDELVERERRRQTRGAAEGGHVKKFNTGGITAQDYFDATSGNQGNSSVRGKLSQFVSDNAGALLTSAVGGLFGLMDDNEQQPVGYQGGIPDYTAQRSLLPNAFAQTTTDPTTGETVARRPGSMGRRYFTDVKYTPTSADAVMQGVGLPAVVPPGTTPAGTIPAGLNTQALDGILNPPPAGTIPAGTTTFGTPTGNAQKPYGYGTEDIFPYFEQGLSPADIIATDSRFGSIQPGTAAYDALMQDYTYWQNNVAATTPAGTTLTGGDADTTDFFYGADGTRYDNQSGYKNTTVASYLADGTLSDSEAASIAGLLEASTDEGKAAIMSTFDAFDPSFGTQFQGYLDSLANDQMGETTYVRNQNPDGTYSYRSFQGMGLVEGDEIITKDQYDAFMASQNTNTGGDTTTTDDTTQTATDFLLDLGYGEEMTGSQAADKLTADLGTMAESNFGVDTLLDTLGIDTAEEKANVAKLTNNPFLKLDIAGGESNVLPEGVGGMDVLSPAEAALQQDLISKQAASLAQAGSNPFQQAIYSSLSGDTTGLQDSLPYYAGVVGDVLRSGGDTIAGAAEKFDLTVPQAAEELMLTGAMTPEEVAGLVNTSGLTKNGAPATTGDSALDMMIALIEGGTTTLEEAAYIYGIPANQAEAVYKDVIKNRLQPIQAAAQGGMMQGQGYYLGGPTDGMADLVPATIDGTQPAALSDGEFVIPADVVSHLGNGNSEAGAQQLYSMMDRVRTERTGTTKQGPEIDPTKMMPA